ncbi:MAG TPA: lytic transglycosylase domain-containing protein [Pyrinomonadaceae bacterium]|jgi:hypothetical protein|nr:lytic transglycosylase domain-containing protein [Pyrinomonadaceae bacterium]
MNKLFLVSLTLLLCAVSTAAQTSARYCYDNFDTQQGVSVEVPQLPSAVSARTTRLTAKTAATMLAASPPRKQPGKDFISANTMVMAAGKSLDGFTTGNRDVDSLIVDAGSRNGVDPVLLYAIMHRESAFKQRAVSHKGARGLMQLMPATAARFGVSNIFDPRQNIEGGARYMRFLLNFFDGSVDLALAGYNAGEGAVLKYGGRVPPYNETQEYVRRITQRYALMRDPQTARRAPVITTAQVASIKAETPAPMYELNVFAVRLPDGRLQLISR